MIETANLVYSIQLENAKHSLVQVYCSELPKFSVDPFDYLGYFLVYLYDFQTKARIASYSVCEIDSPCEKINKLVVTNTMFNFDYLDSLKEFFNAQSFQEMNSAICRNAYHKQKTKATHKLYQSTKRLSETQHNFSLKEENQPVLREHSFMSQSHSSHHGDSTLSFYNLVSQAVPVYQFILKDNQFVKAYLFPFVDSVDSNFKTYHLYLYSETMDCMIARYLISIYDMNLQPRIHQFNACMTYNEEEYDYLLKEYYECNNINIIHKLNCDKAIENLQPT